MRNPLEHEEVYFQFVKNHDLLKHIHYTETPVQNQNIIGIVPKDGYTKTVKELMKNKQNVIIDPNYDSFYKDFLQIDHDLDSVEYIKNKLENSTRQEIVDFTINNIKKLIAQNIFANYVYIVVYPDWPTDWLDKIIGE